jgi:hypothetical protein
LPLIVNYTFPSLLLPPPKPDNPRGKGFFDRSLGYHLPIDRPKRKNAAAARTRATKIRRTRVRAFRVIFTATFIAIASNVRLQKKILRR